MIRVRIEGLEELEAGLARASSNTKKILQQAIRKSGELTKQNIAREAPVFEGTLKKSITNKVGALKAEVFVGAGAEKYGYVQEFGRTSKRMPPPKALERWAAAKLGSSDLAFVLARSIARKGTRPQPFFKPGFETSIDGIEKLLERAADEIVNSI